MKSYLLVDVFGIDCTGGGVTHGKTQAYLECITGPFSGVNDDLPKLKIRPRHYGGVMAIPAELPDDAYPMFGGHFIHSSDSRFISDQPIHVHDRFED